MSVTLYGLDRQVFTQLQLEIQYFEEWKSKASDIGDYVATWGVVRFWALSRSKKDKGGKDSQVGKAYFAWKVARKVLCSTLDASWGIKPCMDTNKFQEKFYGLESSQQMLVAELLLEIADTIQFWTMRFDEVQHGSIVSV